ncbi:glycolate oxidase subunit GlcE [Aromatoleum toluolicum]|uniref:Glycolate oxidase subunit GlcE n=1 Tax=Aromatoleum toluolicum TaxID=90060 RepID=A0ABX1NC92_9RHOO|nr:glycolate oxidase subunit GlcE [Aromatoleum toluolicum]NMF96835.1 glycolate oxidase subunit GlcE [Aromatoleum toluolicum]
MSDLTEQWREQVRAAAAAATALQVRGGGTKEFYGRTPVGEVFDTRGHAGVVSYEPTELVVTVRAGTPLAELEAQVAGSGQMLAFEPPHFGAGATVGGCVAAGLSGPRRATAGALRDFVLGVRILDGRGEVLSFGGQVMKNVAGYDVSRAIAGSLGTLGVILDVSLKVLPRPLAETTLRFAIGEKDAIDRLNDWGGQPLPVSASTWADGALHLRLSGAEAAVRAAERKLGGDVLADDAAAALWQDIREQTDAFFADAAPGEVLWRLSLPSSAAPVKLPGKQLFEWGGALRWLCSDAPAATIRERVAALGGHATAFRSFDRPGDVFQPLPTPVMAIQRRLKQAFDPAGIFNPGRLYDGI